MKTISSILLCSIVSLAFPTAHGALLNLTQTPLFTATYVTPNIFFELDDSGSMDWEVSVAPYWHFCAYDPNATGAYSAATVCGGIVANDGLVRSYGNGNYRYFTYIFENDDNLYSDNCNTDDYNAIESCSSAGEKEWRIFSADLNTIYYNPTTIYTPWIGACTNGGDCSDANFSSARSNPRQGSDGFGEPNNLAGEHYEVWIDNRGYDVADGRPLRAAAVNATATANGEIDLWDSHIKIQLDSSNVKVYRINYTPTVFSLGETETLMATLSSNSACYNVLGPADLVRQIYNGALSYTSTGAEGCRTISETKTNFANWYQYDRRRSFAAKNSIGKIMDRFPNYRYGINMINNTDNFFIEMPPSTMTDFSSFNNDLLSSLYLFEWQALGTPLRQGLGRAGQYYENALSGKPSPIIHACQQNFTILFTDGYWNDFTAPSYIGDDDYDGISQTLADVARYYYLKDLSPLANILLPNAFDPATYQHMVTFTVGFGVAGLLKDTDGDGWPNPPLGVSSNWGNPFNSDAEKVDDLWHAAFNSKGAYLNAQSASTITESLGKILANISDRAASAAPVAQNSAVLNANSQIYQSVFNTNNWTGDLLAYAIGLDNQLATTPTWSAGCALTGGACSLTGTSYAGITPNNRVVITRNWTGANNGIAFRWPSNYASYKVSGSLPTNLARFLEEAPYSANTSNSSQISANQAYGQQLLNYLRGDRSQESQNGGTYDFRNRTTLLSDIVDSAPIYIAGPTRVYPDNLESTPYSTFKLAHQNRTPMIYVGGNDGMLHGFLASNGLEKLAYIPGSRQIFQNLPSLSISPYQHKFFVDATPIDNDVYYNGAWHTILAGTLGNGGQHLYALDITNPTQFTESNAANLYLFEFSDLNDPDFGYVQGQPIIAKVRTGTNQSKWAIIVNNGYNSRQADGSVSSTGKACLFIFFIEAGLNGNWVADQNYIKIPVGSTNLTNPNGLSTPYAVDVDSDYVVDYVYAGDLKGNMWKFDLRSTTPTNWKSGASILYSASFATAGDQPITAPPVVGPHPNGISYGVMVYFGTGKYLELTDNSVTNQVTQAFYGIWDKLQGATVAESSLVQQQIVGEATVGTNTFRAVSSNPINWNTSPGPQKLGWYINLVVNGANNGERQISQPILRNNNVIFTTMRPSTNPCDFGGSSWLMELDVASGGAPELTPFDSNNDGIFTEADFIPITIGGLPVTGKIGGIKSPSGITGTPTVLLTADKSKEVKVTSGSQGLSTIIENPGKNPGRQNWRQFY